LQSEEELQDGDISAMSWKAVEAVKQREEKSQHQIATLT